MPIAVREIGQAEEVAQGYQQGERKAAAWISAQRLRGGLGEGGLVDERAPEVRFPPEVEGPREFAKEDPIPPSPKTSAEQEPLCAVVGEEPLPPDHRRPMGREEQHEEAGVEEHLASHARSSAQVGPDATSEAQEVAAELSMSRPCSVARAEGAGRRRSLGEVQPGEGRGVPTRRLEGEMKAEVEERAPEDETASAEPPRRLRWVEEVGAEHQS